ncbi:MAG: tRNA pseudouridine(55) synthase TruB, partial [Candidatus Rokubacteria bacterium]|nr:tRNA pseudouridine(55) synthase TruB [Candidatus Rokubacteria bacterium]
MGAIRSGILSIEKGAGVSSFQAVAYLRRLLRAHKIGHGGTLDPEATGVLPILINEATKLSPYMMDQEKEYVATVRLGVVTDTQDLSGSVLRTSPVPAFTPQRIEEVLSRFVGTIRQVPPMFSALHHGGRRLYELARRGVEVEREPREVRIHALSLESVALPSFTIRVVCGRGTYVRALSADLGEALGPGGSLERLVRTRVGPYVLERALPWALVRETADPGLLWDRLERPDSALGHWPSVRLGAAAVDALLHGRAVPMPDARSVAPGLVRLYAAEGEFLGVGQVVG